MTCENFDEFTDAQRRHGFPYKQGIALSSHNVAGAEDRRVLNDNLKNIACLTEYLRGSIDELNNTPGKWTATDLGLIITPSSTDLAYYPQVIDVRELGWPCDFILLHSTDHGAGGIHLHVCTGDPKVSINWKSYSQAVIDGDFDSVTPKPAANPIWNPAGVGTVPETAYTQYIGGVWYVTTHQSSVPGALGSQTTTIASGSGAFGLLNLAVASPAILLDYDPALLPGNGHTGYFRWWPTPAAFTGIDTAYMGYSLGGGGDYSHNILWGSNSILTGWQIRGFVDREHWDIGLPSTWYSQIRLHDIGSMLDRVALVAASEVISGGAYKLGAIYQVRMSPDGLSFETGTELLLDRGGVGTFNETITGSYSSIDYNNEKLLFYGATNSSNENTIGLAKLNPVQDSSLPAFNPLRGSFQNELYHDFILDASLPAWLTSAHAGAAFHVFNSSGIRLKSAGTGSTATASINCTTSVIPNDVGRIQITLYDVKSGASYGTRIPWIGFREPSVGGSTTGDNEIRANTFSTPNGLIQLTVRSAGVNITQTNSVYDLGYGVSDNEVFSTHPSIGLDWHADSDVLQLIAGSGESRTFAISGAGANKAISYNAGVSVNNSGDLMFRAIRISWGR